MGEKSAIPLYRPLGGLKTRDSHTEEVDLHTEGVDSHTEGVDSYTEGAKTKTIELVQRSSSVGGDKHKLAILNLTCTTSQ